MGQVATLDKLPAFAGRLNDVVFRDDRKGLPLQAADLLAYEIRRHTWTRIEKGEAPMCSAYQRIKEIFAVEPENPPYRERRFRCYDGRFLVAMAEEVKDDLNDPDKLMNAWYHLDAPED